MTDTYLKPRLSHLLKWPDFNGYGFNLHAEKGKAGQYIGKVDDGSPAEAAGMKDGDRIVEVNGVNIGNENHQQVVGRIKAGGDHCRLLVVDNETDQHYKDQKQVVKGDLLEVVVIDCPSHDTEPDTEPAPAPAQEEVPPSYNDVTEPEAAVAAAVVISSTQVEEVETTHTTTTSQYRPRLCHIKKRSDFNGYGFNLHAERDKPGQFIGKIDEGSPSEAADLREGDRIIEVNGTNIESDTHHLVIELIKSGGDETELLVIDKTTDENYKSRGVTVSSSLAEVQHNSSVTEEGHVSAVVEPHPIFHIPPPPDTPPEEEEDYIVDELRDLGVSDEQVEETVEATQVAEAETEVTQAEDFPPPQEVEQQFSAEVADTVEAVAVDTETSAAEEVTQLSEEITQNGDEINENTAEVAETWYNTAIENVQNDVEVTQAAEAEVEVADDVQAAVEEEIKESVVTEVSENAPYNAVNGQTTEPEPVTTYSPPEPEPTPAPVSQPEPTPVPVSQPEPTPAPKQANGSADIFGISAAEMKERLRSRKKADPRSQHVGFGEKHKMFERL